jgi:hypothetical protein
MSFTFYVEKDMHTRITAVFRRRRRPAWGWQVGVPLRRRVWALFMAVGVLGAGLHIRAADAVVRLPFTVVDAAGKRALAVLELTAGGTPVLRAEIGTRRTVVTVPGQADRGLTLARRLLAGPHELVLKLRAGRVGVSLDREQVGDLAGPESAERLEAVFTPGEGILAADKVRIQKTDPVLFGDDFAREGDAASQWEPSGGRFVLCTSLNPGSSQSAFQMWASAPRGRAVALAAASRWFWDDLVTSVSGMAPALPATWGVVLHAASPGTYHAAVWRQGADGQAGTLVLLRRRSGKETVLAAAPLAMAPGQWYRLTVVTHGARARVFIGGVEVLHADDPTLVGGRVGLLAEDSADVYFDDADIVSAGPETVAADWQPAQPFGPCEQAWSDFSKKSFYTDPYMVQWAHPRSSWDLDAKAGLHWFRTRFFHDLNITWTRAAGQPLEWPQKELAVVVFADREQGGDSGYRVVLGADRIALTRRGVAASTAPLAVAELSTVAVAVAAGRVTVAVNGQETLVWQDPEPLDKGEVAAQFGPTAEMTLGTPDWRDTTRIQSSHRLDYGFDAAPAAWSVGAGRWQGDHRWACVPKWSFFGGRGEAGPPECSSGAALLWNLRRFAGDFDLEVFAAPMEGTPQRMHFANPVTVDLAFMADGQNLDSGYLLIFGTYDIPSQLFREGKLVAEWSGRVAPGLRRHELEWYQRVTRVWQHLRICRRGERLTVDAARHDAEANYLGLERIFDIQEASFPAGDRIGLWTWGPNGLSVARAAISFERSPGTAPAVLPEARTSLRNGGKGEPREIVRVRNPQPGGFFEHDLGPGPASLDERGVLSFSARFPETAVLSLMARVRGQTAEVILTGPDAYRPFTIPLGRATVTPAADYAGWNRYQADLGAALRGVCPQGALVLERLAISSPYDGVEQIAGLGRHRQGDVYELAEVAWSAATAAPTVVPAALAVTVYGRRPLDDFEADTAAWRRLGGPDGAALYRDAHEPASGHASLRLLNQTVGGPAGAWITRDPYPLAAFPRLRFEYRLGADIELNLLVRANGRDLEIGFTGTDSAWPLVGTIPEIKADGQWQTAEFDLAGALQPQFAGVAVTIESLALADSLRMSTSQRTAYWIDSFCRVPALDPEARTELTLQLSDGTAPSAYSLCADAQPGTDPGTTPTAEGALAPLGPGVAGSWIHLRARRADGSWTEPVHLPAVLQKPGPTAVAPAPAAALPNAVPAAPRILYLPSDRLCLDRFDWQDAPEYPDGQFGEVSIRREAWALQGEGDGVVGAGCVILQNLDPQGFYSVYLRRSAWDPLRWPMVSFDYRFEQPGCALNLEMLVNGAMTVVEWTGPNPPGSYFSPAVVGQTEPALQDGAWHHTEFNLAAMLLAARFPTPETRARIAVTELATWATAHAGFSGNTAETRVRLDNLCLYSNRGTAPAFAWEQPPGTPAAEGYAVAFDGSADTVPPETITTTATQAEFSGVKPGVWYLHVRAKTAPGWGPTAHRAITID